MRQLQIIFTAVAILLIVMTSACGNPATATEPSQATQAPAATEMPEAETPETQTAEDPEFALPDFSSAKFDNPTVIDNKWFPLTPGTHYVYDGFTEEGGSKIDHSIEFTVTDLTKEVLGVQIVVAYILDYSAGELVEAEIAFYAQDNAGNVWFMGEYPEVYELGKLVEAPAWIPGLKNAQAGIVMKANPQLGVPSYAQGWGPAVNWSDRGRVIELGQSVCVPVSCYEDVLMTEEFSQTEPDAFQIKYYAPGIGNIKVGWRGEDASREELEMTEYVQLDADGLAEIRAAALELEQSAYKNSKEVYGSSSPMVGPEGVAMNEQSVIASTGGSLAEIVVYASDLPESALVELEFYDDPASPGGRYVSLPNSGDELDAPPENDPYVTIVIPVQSDTAYRCWVHMKVGAPEGRSTANIIYAQFTDSVDATGNEVLKPRSRSYLTAQGPSTEGWHWVACNQEESEALVYFSKSGEVTVRLQAGAEGVGFDQFVLSSEQFLDSPPAVEIVEK
ncbi:MAG: hypothetical protein AB1649_29090 [Chloroflexota bacterium]